MKLLANIEVNHRTAASYSMPKRRSQRSSLTLGTKPGYPNELILVHRSCQNVMGTVYRVKGNIDKVFDRYVQEGKMTIRFKEPPHDLIINGEAPSLKKFILLLKMALRSNVSVKCLKLPVVSSEPLKKIPPKPKQHLKYLSKSEYPVLEGFPRSAVSIKISGIQKTTFDMRLLGLPQLKVLDLSDNQLTELPAEIDLLQSLQVLSLANNHLGAGKKTAWVWLRGERLSRQLQELDLSDNELTFLHPAVCQLRALQTLKIKNNQLRFLPGAIGTLNHLKTLIASANLLECLPGSIFLLKLWYLDITNNFFIDKYQRSLAFDVTFPSLMELAARCVVNNRLRFGSEDVPLEVQRYLDTVSFCHCGKASFESGRQSFGRMNLSSVAENIVRQMGDTIDLPVHFRQCSFVCMIEFNNISIRESLREFLGDG